MLLNRIEYRRKSKHFSLMPIFSPYIYTHNIRQRLFSFNSCDFFLYSFDWIDCHRNNVSFFKCEQSKQLGLFVEVFDKERANLCVVYRLADCCLRFTDKHSSHSIISSPCSPLPSRLSFRRRKVRRKFSVVIRLDKIQKVYLFREQTRESLGKNMLKMFSEILVFRTPNSICHLTNKL